MALDPQYGPAHTHSAYPGYGGSINKMQRADTVLSIERDGSIHILKSRRDGITGLKSLGTVVDLMSHMLASSVFNGNLEMFQEGLKIQLVEAISKVLIKEGGEKIENSVQRKI